MLVLFETVTGSAHYRLDVKKLQEVESLWKEFETAEKANKMGGLPRLHGATLLSSEKCQEKLWLSFTA
uniref:Uncharacterized protein n=1 Tax=Scleropages formosus TaxID=113540 RepID=A0A8C9VC21_SCLFO